MRRTRPAARPGMQPSKCQLPTAFARLPCACVVADDSPGGNEAASKSCPEIPQASRAASNPIRLQSCLSQLYLFSSESSVSGPIVYQQFVCFLFVYSLHEHRCPKLGVAVRAAPALSRHRRVSDDRARRQVQRVGVPQPHISKSHRNHRFLSHVSRQRTEVGRQALSKPALHSGKRTDERLRLSHLRDDAFGGRLSSGRAGEIVNSCAFRRSA